MANVVEIAQNIKVAGAVAAGTTASGVGSAFEMIPDDIGKLAALVGAILSVVLIYVHVRKWWLERRKGRLEVQILREKLKQVKGKN